MTDQPLIKLEKVGKQFSKGFEHGHRTLGRELLALFFGGKPAEAKLDDPEAFWALQDVSFEVRKGEVLAVIGHNGAGKTTLLRMLNGEFNHDRGQLVVSGHRSSLIDLTAGFSMNMSGRENIYFRGAHLGFDRAFLRQKESEILAFAELDDFIDSPIKTYSSGMLLRLGFAITVFAEPDVLLMDEVLSVGDFLFEQKCMNRINQLRERSAVVIVTHSMGTVANFADRCLLLDRGQPVFLGRPVDAIEAYYKLEAEKQRKGLRLSRATPRVALDELLAVAPGVDNDILPPSVSDGAENDDATLEIDATNTAIVEKETDVGISQPETSDTHQEWPVSNLIAPIDSTAAGQEATDDAATSWEEADLLTVPDELHRPFSNVDEAALVARAPSDDGSIDPEKLPPLARAAMHQFLRSDHIITDVIYQWTNMAGEDHPISGTDGVSLRIEFTAVRRVRRLVLGVPVWSEDGVLITAFGTHIKGIVQNLEPGRHAIELQIPAIRLNKGTYYPVVAILDQNEFVYRWPTEPLVIASGAEVMTWGLVTLNYNWKQSSVDAGYHKRFNTV